jgi:hypothetical protein
MSKEVGAFRRLGQEAMVVMKDGKYGNIYPRSPMFWSIIGVTRKEFLLESRLGV